MNKLRVAVALAVAMLAWTSGAVLGQDEGKTEAAKLASESQAALQQLTAGVPLAAELLAGSHVVPSTVIGFPHGGTTTATKVRETELACRDGPITR